MHDERIEKLADLLVNYSVNIQPGQKVLVRGSTYTIPLIRAVYTKVLAAGGLPFVVPSIPELDHAFFSKASDSQLQFIHPPMKLIYETYDAFITIMGEANTRALTNIDPGRMILRGQATRPLSELFLGRAGRGELHWTLTLFPTDAHAQDADMSLEEYEDFVYQACMPDLKDPVGYWKQVSAKQQKIIDWLHGKHEVHLLAPETDLRLSIEGRTFINCDCKENVPDGEIFTGPVESSVEGHVFFSYPTIYEGREVDGVRLWFENGKVSKATAKKNEEFLLKTLDSDEGSRYVGEFAIGTNEGIKRFTREILFDEKIGGSFHLALGEGYPESGSINHSSIHWDMVCDLRQGGEITVDGELFYKDGKFVLDL